MEILRRQGIALMQEYRVPVVVEVIRERVTNISMGGADIANVVEFEELAERGDDAPPRSPGRTEPIR